MSPFFNSDNDARHGCVGPDSTPSPTKARKLTSRGRVSFLLLSLIGVTALVSGLTVVDVPRFIGTQDKDVNVLFIILDEAPLFPLIKTDGTINGDRFPGFAALADNSTWYRNTVGTAQRTTEAVPAILDGKWPTFKNYPYFKDHPNNLFTLLKGEMDLNVYQSYTHLCPAKLCPNAPPAEEVTPDSQATQLRRTVEAAAVATRPTLNFAHVLLPHRPWGLVPDLRLVIPSPRLQDPRPMSDADRRRDNYQSLLRQYIATDRLISELVERMKTSENWNNTLIVVTADHGITFVPGESNRDKINPLNRGTLEDIYRVPLFIKYPNQKLPSVSDCDVSSIDLLATVIDVTEAKPDWKTQGTSLFSSCPKRESRTLRWPDGETELDTSFTSLRERVRYYNEWVDANGNVDDIYRTGLSGTLLGTDTPNTAISRGTISWELNRPEKFQLIGSGEFAPIVGGASGRLFTDRKICSKCEGLIAINGKFVGVVNEFAGATPQKTGKYFQSQLMTRLLKPGPTTVELWIANWTTKTPRLQRVGPPRK